VSGSKGFDDYPDQNIFKSSNNFKLEAGSINYLLDKINGILQDSMYFNIQMFSSGANTIKLLTNLKEKSSLINRDEKRIGKRCLVNHK